MSEELEITSVKAHTVEPAGAHVLCPNCVAPLSECLFLLLLHHSEMSLQIHIFEELPPLVALFGMLWNLAGGSMVLSELGLAVSSQVPDPANTLCHLTAWEV